MAISSRQLSLLISEIETDLKGGIIKNIDQSDANTLIFEIVQGKQRHRLLFSAHRRFTRVHLVQQKTPRTKMPPGFCHQLRAHLRHKRIERIQQKNNDRIIEISCAWSEESPNTMRFVAELTGTCANFYLLDTKEHILGMLRQAPPSRNLHPGTPYVPPLLHITTRFQETHIPPVNSEAFPLNYALEIYFSELEKQEQKRQKQKETLLRFDTAIKNLKKRLKHLQAKANATENSLRYRDYGEHLKYHLHEVLPGATIFFYPNSHSSDQGKYAVPLNPALSAAQNMAQFFKRYKKAVRERSMHLKLQEETESKLNTLKVGRKAVTEGTVLTLEDFPLLSAQKKPQIKKTKKGLQIYLSSDNLRLMLGRNGLENDTLTFRLARGNDLWFHARGVSGSHLVVKMEKRKALPPKTLLEAATLALYFSAYRKAGKGEVMYTYKKYLQRPKKGKPGSVICTQEKTLFIEIDPARLSSILDNRLHDIRE